MVNRHIAIVGFLALAALAALGVALNQIVVP